MSADSRLEAFADLVRVIDRLRGPDGCPWDRSQAMRDLAPCLLEEAYEAVESLSAGDRGETVLELGDLLMNILLAARIGQDAGDFSLEDISRGIADKLIRRHPHVFEGKKVDGVENVLRNWEQIKKEERSGGSDESALAGVPIALPALMRATRLADKAARAGFEWSDENGPVDKIKEEIAEVEDAISSGTRADLRNEIGDLLLSVVNLARLRGVDAETALREAAEKFEHRFRHVEEQAGGVLQNVDSADLEEMWVKAKVVVEEREAQVPPGTPAEWRAVIIKLVQVRRALIEQVHDLPPDLFEARPQPANSSWSVSEILEHLARVESWLADVLTGVLQKGLDGGELATYPEQGLAAFPPRSHLFKPKGRIESPSSVSPRGGQQRAELLKQLESSRKDLMALVPELMPWNPRGLLLPHPLFGDLDVLQWYEFQVAHELIHSSQVERVLTTLRNSG